MSKWLSQWPLAAITALGVATLAGCAASADAELSAAEYEALKAQIKQELLRELVEKGELDAAVDAGISRFVERQRQARAEAEARQQQGAAVLAKNVRKVSAERDHIYGKPDAVVSLIEYSDFECPFCKRFHPTARKIVDSYDGKVNWVYRHFPLAFHNPGAQMQAEASECAAALGGNDAFWKYTDTIYERTTSNGQGFPIDGLVPLAREIGLDGDAFGDCLKQRRFTKRVEEDYEEGVRIGIR
jgi:protein-disulfide isomerase